MSKIKIKINVKNEAENNISPSFIKNYIPIDQDLPVTEPLLDDELASSVPSATTSNPTIPRIRIKKK